MGGAKLTFEDFQPPDRFQLMLSPPGREPPYLRCAMAHLGPLACSLRETRSARDCEVKLCGARWLGLDVQTRGDCTNGRRTVQTGRLTIVRSGSHDTYGVARHPIQ